MAVYVLLYTDLSVKEGLMYKILIVEDDLAMAQAIQKEMKMWGIRRFVFVLTCTIL